MKVSLGVLIVGLGSLVNCAPANAQPSLVSVVQPVVPSNPLQRRSAARRYRFYDTENRRYLTYEYGKRVHLERMAYKLARNANALCWTAHRYYQGNREFRTTYKEMYNLITGATHIQKLVKEGYYRKRHDTDHIIRDLLSMDKLVDHVRDDVRYWHRHAPAIDPLAAPRPGDQDTVLIQLARLEDTLHHLMQDYGVTGGRRTVAARPGIGLAPKPR